MRFAWDETLYLTQKHGLEPGSFDYCGGREFEDGHGNRLIVPAVLMKPGQTSVGGFSEFLKNIRYQDGRMVAGAKAVFLFRAGRAACAIWRDGELIKTKILTSYVVRASQGRSQGGHNRGKRARSAGAALRARNEVAFLDKVAGLFENWKRDLAHCDQVLYSASPRLWGEILRAQKSSIIARGDGRLEKLGMHTGRPGRAELARALYEITHGSLVLKQGEIGG